MEQIRDIYQNLVHLDLKPVGITNLNPTLQVKTKKKQNYFGKYYFNIL